MSISKGKFQGKQQARLDMAITEVSFGAPVSDLQHDGPCDKTIQKKYNTVPNPHVYDA